MKTWTTQGESRHEKTFYTYGWDESNDEDMESCNQGDEYIHDYTSNRSTGSDVLTTSKPLKHMPSSPEFPPP